MNNPARGQLGTQGCHPPKGIRPEQLLGGKSQRWALGVTPPPLHPSLLWLIAALCHPGGVSYASPPQPYLLFGALVCTWGGYLFVCGFCFGLGFFIAISLVVVAWVVFVDLDLHCGTALCFPSAVHSTGHFISLPDKPTSELPLSHLNRDWKVPDAAKPTQHLQRVSGFGLG